MIQKIFRSRGAEIRDVASRDLLPGKDYLIGDDAKSIRYSKWLKPQWEMKDPLQNPPRRFFMTVSSRSQ